jgi:hypothetical protein
MGQRFYAPSVVFHSSRNKGSIVLEKAKAILFEHNFK